MHCTRKINDDLIWVGADNRRLALFEAVYTVPQGVAYNSYLILDDKTALIVKRFNISDEDGQSFLEGALNVQKRLTRKKNQRYLMILLILIIIAYLISVAGCGGMALPLCLDY
jgi:hypothetical protein